MDVRNFLSLMGFGWKPEDGDMCEACGIRPKYGNFAYCGRTCGQRVPRSNIPCAFPGCHTLSRMNSRYCSELHSREAAAQPTHAHHSWNSGGTWIQSNDPYHSKNSYRQQNGGHSGHGGRITQGPVSLRELIPNDVNFQSLSNYFETTWNLPGTEAKVRKIIETGAPRDRYEKYRKNISGKEIVTYHGAQCICDFGVKSTALCRISSCGICNIVRSSFNSFAFGARHNSGRFGSGIYSYENPALADIFATSCTSSPFRVMIACTVAVAPNGRTHSRSSNGPVSTRSLHDQEPVFVDSTEAIVPAFLILYQKRWVD